MKKLTLLRHAEAQSEAPGLKDFDRPLSDRGRSEVPATAARLRAEQPVNLIVASPALRTYTTAQLLADAIHLPSHAMRTDKRLYLASPAHIKAVIRETDDSVVHLVIVGHNPGISDLAGELVRNSTFESLPTSGSVTLRLDDCESWFDDRFLSW